MRKRPLSATLRLRLCTLGAVLSLLGCESTCPRETEKVPTPYDNGNTNAQRTVYETNAWDETFVHFPAGRRIALRHGLGKVPVTIRSYVAFKECPFPKETTQPGFVAESAGNQVLLERVDSEFVRVRNDTCEEFWLRLVASTADASGTESMASNGMLDACPNRVEEETNAGGSGGTPGASGGAGGVVHEPAGAGGR